MRLKKECARIFADNSLDGVYTHGVNRFSRFIQMVAEKQVLPDKDPTKISSFGGMEQWNGNLGPGSLNAIFCTERSLQLANQNGIGCVGLSNTNHWMRGEHTGGKQLKKAMLLFAGQTQLPICRHGVQKIVTSEIIHLL